MLIRRDPLNQLYREFNRLQDELGRAFSRGNLAAAFGSPVLALNIWEDVNNVFVEAELPGIDASKLDISVTEGNQLTIQSERPMLEVAGAVWHRQERNYGSFTRVVTLPTLVEADAVEATYSAGVLKLKLPKAEAAKPRKIAVKSM